MQSEVTERRGARGGSRCRPHFGVCNSCTRGEPKCEGVEAAVVARVRFGPAEDEANAGQLPGKGSKNLAGNIGDAHKSSNLGRESQEQILNHEGTKGGRVVRV